MKKMIITSGSTVAVKLNAIPEHRTNSLARGTLHAVERFFALPGVREDFEKWLEEYKEEQKMKGRASENEQ